jgi:hypothetical protein
VRCLSGRRPDEHPNPLILYIIEAKNADQRVFSRHGQVISHIARRGKGIQNEKSNEEENKI